MRNACRPLLSGMAEKSLPWASSSAGIFPLWLQVPRIRASLEIPDSIGRRGNLDLRFLTCTSAEGLVNQSVNVAG